jgi:tRNA(fMet)-specific endonuclease VapC
MLILDTDHLSEYQKGVSSGAKRLKARLDAANEPYGTTVVTVEEMMRGWMAAIRREPDPAAQVQAYGRLRQLFRFFATWDVLDWTPLTAAKYEELRAARLRVGTMDLKIASIAIANSAVLLTRNLRDFSNVPGLRIQDWLS